MPSITHAYTIAQDVFHVDASKGVREAIIKSISISVTQTGTTLLYDVAFKKPTEGSAVVAESTLYATVDAALTAYRPTILV